MSHFTVMVLGASNESEVEQALAPFDENLATDPRNEPLSREDITQALDYYIKDGTQAQKTASKKLKAAFESGAEVNFEQLAKLWSSWSGKLVVDPDAESGYSRETTYNEQSKWDWYQIGGRWSGYFKLKPGAEGARGEPGVMGTKQSDDGVDIARKGDIDFEAMRKEAGDEAGARWDKFHEAVAGLPVPDSWDVVRARHGEKNINAAREEYHGAAYQKAVGPLLGWMEEREKFLVTREEFVERARKSAVASFAVLKDGTWHEKGSMGWFGMARDEKDGVVWAEEVGKLLDSLPDDTYIAVVDCHI